MTAIRKFIGRAALVVLLAVLVVLGLNAIAYHNTRGLYVASGWVDRSSGLVDRGGKELWAGTFEVDPTAVPKVWGRRSHDGKKEGKDPLGIYELAGDALKVACVVGQ